MLLEINIKKSKNILMFKHFKIQLTFLFANDVNDRGLILKIYEPCMQLTTTNKNKQTNWKMGRRPKQTFL